MQVKNKDGEYIAILDDNLFEGDTKFIITNVDDILYIRKDDNRAFFVKLDNDLIIGATIIKICIENNSIYIRTHDVLNNLTIIRTIKQNSIITLTNNNGDILGETCELPKFYESESDEIYPKFDIEISDCIFSMKIFYSNFEYIDIPECQIYDNIFSTIKYIEDVINYFRNVNNNFIRNLCEYKAATFIVRGKDDKSTFFSSEFKLTTRGILINLPDQENYLLEFHRLFKLIIDGKWDVIFIDID